MPQIFYQPSTTKPKSGPGVITVKQYRPWLCMVIIVFFVVVAGVVLLLFSENNLQALRQNRRVFIEQYLQEQERHQKEIQTVIEYNNNLIEQNEALQTQLTVVMRTMQTNEETYAKVLQSLSKLQDDHFDLKEELLFYQQLLIFPNPSRSPTPIVVHFTLD